MPTRSQRHLREYQGYDSAGDDWQQPGSVGFGWPLDTSGVARPGSLVRVANAFSRIDSVDFRIIGFTPPPVYETQAFTRTYSVPLKDQTAGEILAFIEATLTADPLGFSVAVDNFNPDMLIVSLEDHLLEIWSP